MESTKKLVFKKCPSCSCEVSFRSGDYATYTKAAFEAYIHELFGLCPAQGGCQ